MIQPRFRKTITIGYRLLLVGALAFGASACVKKGSGGSAPAVAASKSGKMPTDPSKPIAEPPAPPPGPPNPLLGAKLFVDPDSLSMLRANQARKTDPALGAIFDRIAKQPQALWMGGWNSNIFRAVEHFVERAKKDGSVPVMIAYNIPLRDCGQYSKGGLKTLDEYKRWISDVAAGIGNDAAVVILEPDALGHFQECLSEQQKADRLAALNFGVRALRANANTAVYLDIGHARWLKVEDAIERLKVAGIEHANGFSVNTSNYVSTEENMEYAKKISEALGGKHFVIDTSRNGAGPYEEAKTPEESWCNPPGRKIGKPPTTETGEPLCDGFLWLKRPGESDGECRGGPKAGVWWEQQALELAQ
jgi:endoglucanase